MPRIEPDPFPERIPGPAAWVYSWGPGRALRSAQERIAVLADAALREDAALLADFGCGPGWLARALAMLRPAAQVVGLDLSASMVRIAKRRCRALPNVQIRRENVARTSLPDASVDLVVSSESMHHWRRPEAVFAELYRVLRPGAEAWIFDGRDDFTNEDLRVWVDLARDRPERLLRIPRRILGTHGLTRHGWEQTLPELLKRTPFGGGEIEPMGIYRRLRLVR